MTGDTDTIGRETRRYKHQPSGHSWWFYESIQDDDIIAERIDNGDKMRFENWPDQNSEYWEQD